MESGIPSWDGVVAASGGGQAIWQGSQTPNPPFMRENSFVARRLAKENGSRCTLLGGQPRPAAFESAFETGDVTNLSSDSATRQSRETCHGRSAHKIATDGHPSEASFVARALRQTHKWQNEQVWLHKQFVRAPQGHKLSSPSSICAFRQNCTKRRAATMAWRFGRSVVEGCIPCGTLLLERLKSTGTWRDR